ncbi:ribonuclease P protein subunit p21 isoform X2 [Anser cygnoides]|uniref:ribonuclease P protein subunit p21 isoform X2 n=1 Tax=Anser cygnoides TaxID=8845 RepID=UPI0034D1CC6C
MGSVGPAHPGRRSQWEAGPAAMAAAPVRDREALQRLNFLFQGEASPAPCCAAGPAATTAASSARPGHAPAAGTRPQATPPSPALPEFYPATAWRRGSPLAGCGLQEPIGSRLRK